MSKLGKIFEINYKEKIKRMYPVVYKNKSYYYCKINGNDSLLIVPTVDAIKEKYIFSTKKVIPLSDYKELVATCPDNDFVGYVYVSATENYFFNELKYDALTNALTSTNDHIKRLKFFVEGNTQRIKCYEKENANYANQIKELELKKIALEEKILARNKEAIINDK